MNTASPCRIMCINCRRHAAITVARYVQSQCGMLRASSRSYCKTHAPHPDHVLVNGTTDRVEVVGDVSATPWAYHHP